jgi:hypothetical protein
LPPISNFRLTASVIRALEVERLAASPEVVVGGSVWCARGRHRWTGAGSGVVPGDKGLMGAMSVNLTADDRMCLRFRPRRRTMVVGKTDSTNLVSSESRTHEHHADNHSPSSSRRSPVWRTCFTGAGLPGRRCRRGATPDGALRRGRERLHRMGRRA